MYALEVRLILREELQPRDQAVAELQRVVDNHEYTIKQLTARLEDLEQRLTKLGGTVSRGLTVYR